MNVGDIRRAVDLRTGISMTGAAMIEYVNQGLQEYATHARWPWLRTTQTLTSDGEGPYTLNAAVLSIESVTVNGEPAFPVSQAEVDVYDHQVVRSGYLVAATGDSLTVKPEPASGVSIVVSYVRSEPVVADDDDTPLLPDVHRPMLSALVASYIFDREADSRASWHRQQATEMLRGMEKSAFRKTARGRQIRVRPGAW